MWYQTKNSVSKHLIFREIVSDSSAENQASFGYQLTQDCADLADIHCMGEEESYSSEILVLFATYDAFL